MSQKIAVIGIHTDIGKTICSAVITQALKADYWKPVQAGDLSNSDSIKVASYISNTESKIHPEAIRLQMAASPHTAAAAENLSYDFREFKMPDSSNTLIIETAGGVFSPIDASRTVIDFVDHFNLPVVLVTRHYLGSINHTLLCLDALHHRKIPILSLVINGDKNESTESFIQAYGKVKNMLYVPELSTVNQDSIREAAKAFYAQWQKIEKK